MIKECYRGKRVLVTGHTGFKGSWLTTWLLDLGAKVAGLSNGIPTNPSMFEDLALEDKISHYIADVRDSERVYQIIEEYKPDFIFHLAAQPIVSVSYDQPLETIGTNVFGTAVVIDAVRRINRKCNLVLITSDKCYENVEWLWGYKETDQLGGSDIYSASKGAAELIINSFYKSFVSHEASQVRMASARAGNVIGGGDWAKDRIVVDCVKNWAKSQPVTIRSPQATRPWQHVLEPLSGYLMLGALLENNTHVPNGESYNFGPQPERSRSVGELISDLAVCWGFNSLEDAFIQEKNQKFGEAGLLKLNCEKALHQLNWEATLEYSECVSMVAEWYKSYFNNKNGILKLTLDQIHQYESLARKRGLRWCR